MIKKIAIIPLAWVAVAAFAQPDTLLNRTVTVERDFETTIETASKVDNRPEVVPTNIPQVKVVYSDYQSGDMAPTSNIQTLLSQPQRFTAPQQLNGLLEGGVGHINTLLNFHYQVRDAKKNYLDIYADHEGEWGFRTNVESQLGMRYKHSFKPLDVYFDIKGENRYYTHYGRYYNDVTYTIDRYSQLAPEDKQIQWRGRAIVGVQSAKTEDHQYKVEAGCQMLHLPGYATELQGRVRADMNFLIRDIHHVGLNTYAQTNHYQVDTAIYDGRFYQSRYNIRLEPFYEYEGKRFFIHTGIHLDVNVGKGTQLSTIEGVSFAPSPNVHFEAQLAPQCAILYGQVDGRFGYGSLQSYMDKNRYLEIIPCITSQHVSGYTPIDMELGFRFKMFKNLLLQVYVGYAYELNQSSYLAFLEDYHPSPSSSYEIRPGTFTYFYSDYDRCKVGAALSYHYQDIIDIHVDGNYYVWHHINMTAKSYLQPDELCANFDFEAKKVYDRPSWDAHLRVDAHINSHWSLYSDNRLAGTRLALVALNATTVEERTLPMFIDINLGGQYEWTDINLALFLQLNNIINRHNMILYGYDSEGINGLMGVRWKF